MPLLYTVAELLAVTGGRGENLPEDGVASLGIDSREITRGALFVAIQGDRFDGHDFVRTALESGAAIALVSEARASEFTGLPILVVADALVGMTDLARHARARSNARIVAVTGSAGKTTTREAIKLALRGAGETHASIKSFNNHWGVPLMLARMQNETAFGIFEIGMNHAGEITPLSELVRPHVSVITNVAAAHLEAFDSVADIARAKAEIFSGMTPGGTAILNADHDYLDVLLTEAARQGVRHVITYGFAAFSDVRIRQAEPTEDGMRAKIEIDGTQHEVSIKAHGRHMMTNAAAALAVTHVLGGDIAPAIANLRNFTAPGGRGEVHMLGTGERSLRLIDESYNANPASMRAALEVFASQQSGAGSKILILGDMLELGPRGPELHAGLLDAVISADADQIYLVGSQIQALADRLGEKRVTGSATDVLALVDQVLNNLAFGDTVMVKGSNGIRLSSLISRIREKFAGDKGES